MRMIFEAVCHTECNFDRRSEKIKGEGEDQEEASAVEEWSVVVPITLVASDYLNFRDKNKTIYLS